MSSKPVSGPHVAAVRHGDEMGDRVVEGRLARPVHGDDDQVGPLPRFQGAHDPVEAERLRATDGGHLQRR